MIDVIIIGGGPAGLIASFYASKNGGQVVLLEKNNSPGRKLLITGKGRCNLTNNGEVEDFIANTKTNSKFMYSAFYSFTKDDIIEILNNNGVKTKVERGNRVFPASNMATDVVSALVRNARQSGVSINQETVTDIKKIDHGWQVLTENTSYQTKSVIIATGGLSYPKTGSTGDGYVFAKSLGHTVKAPEPSLIPINIKEDFCKDMMGLSLKNVKLELYNNKTKKVVFFDQGEMIFTHFGVSGPMVLSASAHIELRNIKDYQLSIDWKPALDLDTLDKRLQKDFAKFSNKDFKNSLEDLLPKKSIDTFIKLSKIDGNKKSNQITKEERQRLLALLKGFKLTPVGFREIDYAVVTSGGINVNEIDSSTMESEIHKNLFFAGEVIDVDAYTGGFNLQVAYSTGFLAGTNAYKNK